MSDQIGAAFCYRYGRRINVSADQIREHRRIDDAQPLDTAYPQSIVYHRHLIRIGTHLTGACWVMRGDRGLPRIGLDLCFGCDVGTGTDLSVNERLEFT